MRGNPPARERAGGPGRRAGPPPATPRPARYIKYGAPFAWVDEGGRTRQAVSAGAVDVGGATHYRTGGGPCVPFWRVDPLGTPPSSWCIYPGRDYPDPSYPGTGHPTPGGGVPPGVPA